MSPCVSNNVILRLYDYDAGKKDENVGCQYFKLDDIREGVFKNPFWINLYGAHIDAEPDQREYLCSHPDLGTQWAGRIFLGMEIYDCEEPVLKLEHI